jgi:DNA-binding NarL/FixJ family response regulator
MFIKKSLSFLLTDDHSVVRKGFSLIIEDLVEKPIIHHASTINDALTIIQNTKLI